jgi:hypothetical protein
MKLSEIEAIAYIKLRAEAIVQECNNSIETEFYDMSYLKDKSNNIANELKRLEKFTTM